MGKIKIAFCFLLYDSIQHISLWKDFFIQDYGKNRFNIYTHIKKKTKKTPKLLWDRRVNSVSTGWCGEGIVFAYNEMLIEALKDPDNKYFCLISGSCIPLYSFDKTYKMITSSKKGRFPFKGGEVTLRGEKDLYVAEQWNILTKPLAKTLVRLSDKNDYEAQEWLKYIRNLYKSKGVYFYMDGYEHTRDHIGKYNWIGGCPDELYPINWFSYVYGKPSSKLFKKMIKNQMTTFTKWSTRFSHAHPVKFNKISVRINSNKICRSKSIFARKFTKGGAKYIVKRCAKKSKRRRGVQRSANQ